jgi:hypothetical protein
MATFPTYKNVTAPDLSNLITLQSQGTRNAFNSLADIGNTIQNIQQKNIDRDNRNLLAQGMLAKLNQDTNAVKNVFDQAVNDPKVPVNLLTTLGNNVQKNIDNDRLINEQKLARQLTQGPNAYDNIVLDKYLSENNLPVPKNLFENYLNESTEISNALANYQDQRKVSQATDTNDPEESQRNLNSLDVRGFNTPNIIKLFGKKQEEVDEKVRTQNTKLKTTELDSNKDAYFNSNSPVFKPLVLNSGNEQDAIGQITTDFKERENKAVAEINNADISLVDRQKRLMDLKETSAKYRKEQLTDYVSKGIIDPTNTKNLDLFKGVFSSDEIPNLVNGYNTKNFDFNQNVKSSDPAYAPLAIAKSAIDKYKVFEEKGKSSFNSVLGEALKNKTAFETGTEGGAIEVFRSKWIGLIGKDEIIDTIENIRDELGENNRDLLNTPEILSIMDRLVESQYSVLPGEARVRLSDWFTSNNTLKNGLANITPEKKVKVASEYETKQLTNVTIQKKTQLLQNLRKQYLDPTNPINKEVILNRIREVSDTLNEILLTYNSRKELSVNEIGNN